MKRVCLVALIAAAGCGGKLPWLRGEWVNHPAALVGQWVDVKKTSAADSSIWVLAPNGEDGGMRITHGSNDNGVAHVERRYYGYWYVRGEPGHDQALCVNRHPGRSPSSCTSFESMVDSTFAPPRRAIRLTAYTGEHHTGQRLLVERR